MSTPIMRIDFGGFMSLREPEEDKYIDETRLRREERERREMVDKGLL